MLHELRIRDFALIQEVSVEFLPGFNVLTGETGAGKSIIIDALAFLLGARAQNEQIRSGAEEAVVEGSFDPLPFPEFRDLMEGAGLHQDPDQFLLLKRHLLNDGKNKAYINGSLVSLSVLRELGDYLVDIQGQHQSQSLLESRRQQGLLDAYAGHQEKVKQLQHCYQRVQWIKKELAELSQDQGDVGKREELLEFQRAEIEAVQLKPEEEEEIAREASILSNAERLFGWCEATWGKICDEPGAALDSISSAISSLKEGKGVDPRLATPLEALQSARIYLEEAASFLKSYQGKIDFDSGRLEELEVRLSIIAKLKRKYGGTVSEILNYHRQLLRELEDIRGLAERQARISSEREGLLQEMGRLALEISRARREAGISMGEKVQQELRQLGMPGAIFLVELSDLEDPAGELVVEDKRYPPSPRGIDGVDYLFSSNPGEEVKALSKIISGGELSRVVLALKTTLAALDEIQTLVLDEVDTGISGSMAEVVGQKLRTLGSQRQVLCITHLPHIATFGDAHFSVIKQQQGDRTVARVQRLRETERVNEIGRMLGDKGISQTPLRHAREILSQAREWKRGEDATLTTPKRI
ncbi:MAG: DNA repair protein RecN [bacterium]